MVAGCMGSRLLMPRLPRPRLPMWYGMEAIPLPDLRLPYMLVCDPKDWVKGVEYAILQRQSQPANSGG